MRRARSGWEFVGVTALVLVCLATTVAGQAPRQTPAPWNPPRTADGQPDMQGFWGEEGGGANGTNVETGFQTADTLRVQGMTEAELAARKPMSAIETPDHKIPYQPWAEARRQQNLARYGGDELTQAPQTPRDINPELFCILGMPRLAYWQDFQVVQAPGYVIMQWERTRSFRIIPLDGRPHPPAAVKTYMGDARGHWEGNTLVVNTTNLRDWSWFDSKGTLHTDAMTMVERYTLVDANTVRLQIAFDDPNAFTKPFTMTWTLHREHTADPQFELMEYACAEGERAFKAVYETALKPTAKP